MTLEVDMPANKGPRGSLSNAATPSFPLSMRHAAVTEVDGLSELEVLVEVRSHEWR